MLACTGPLLPAALQHAPTSYWVLFLSSRDRFLRGPPEKTRHAPMGLPEVRKMMEDVFAHADARD